MQAKVRYTNWRKARDELAVPVAVVTVIFTGLGASLAVARLLGPLPHLKPIPLAIFCIACWLATFFLLNAKQEGLARRLAPRLVLYSFYTCAGCLALLVLAGVVTLWP